MILAETATPLPQSVDARLYAATGAAQALAARITAAGTHGEVFIQVDGEAVARRIPTNALNASERFAKATRRIELANGDVLEVDDGAQLSRVLSAAGLHDARVTRWQHSWRMVLTSLVLSIVAAIAGYIWVLPFAADRLARLVPPSWMQSLDEVVIGQLKRQDSLAASTLSEERQTQLRNAFTSAVSTHKNAPTVNVYFFKMGSTPNAFALPGGSIVFLDGIVKLAPNDDALVGVFAHEYGHVLHRHGMRNLLRTALVSAVAAWYFGDFTTLANAAILITQLKYSRDFETQADDTAVEIMRSKNLDTKSLAELFRRMRDHSGVNDDDHKGADKEKAGTNEKPTPDAPVTNETTDKSPAAAKGPKVKISPYSIPEFLSTHPDIERRIERFDGASKTAPKP